MPVYSKESYVWWYEIDQTIENLIYEENFKWSIQVNMVER